MEINSAEVYSEKAEKPTSTYSLNLDPKLALFVEIDPDAAQLLVVSVLFGRPVAPEQNA